MGGKVGGGKLSGGKVLLLDLRFQFSNTFSTSNQPYLHVFHVLNIHSKCKFESKVSGGGKVGKKVKKAGKGSSAKAGLT